MYASAKPVRDSPDYLGFCLVAADPGPRAVGELLAGQAAHVVVKLVWQADGHNVVREDHLQLAI